MTVMIGISLPVHVTEWAVQACQQAHLYVPAGAKVHDSQTT